MVQEVSFGQWLRKRRNARDLRQEDLADLAGCSPETIRKLEAGTRKASADMVAAIARHLGVKDEDVPALIRLARNVSDLDETYFGSVARQESATAPLRLGHVHRETNLPPARSQFVGRENEIEEVMTLLQSEYGRLITLTGSPGIGKTRLSMEVGGRSLNNYADGVFFVPLAPVSEPSLVLASITQALGLKESPTQSRIDLLTNYLHNKQMLLILDNFEQVVAAGPLVVEILTACPGVSVIVTSRESLRLYGENQFTVEPLSLPPKGKAQSVQDIEGYEAIRLFVKRAQAVEPGFNLTEQNALPVAEICRRLEGLPLAIELAAARIRILPPQALLTRLREGLDLLSWNMRDLPPRQQTMRGAIAWSYELLTAPEQKMYQRMSVFVGSVALDAIEAVCLDAGDLDTDVFELITTLVEKSLVRQIASGDEPRFWMLWALREFGLERLASSGEADDVRKKHAAYYIRMVEEAEPHLRSGRRDGWLALLEKEKENLRTTMDWCATDDGDHEAGLRIAGALHWFWYFRGYLSEGRERIERALALSGDLRHTAAGAKALDAAGRLALLRDDYEMMISRAEESVASWRRSSDKLGLAYALIDLGAARIFKTRDASSGGVENLLEARKILGEVGDKWGLAFALDITGDIVYLLGGTEQEIEELRKESLVLYRELDDKWGMATELSELGHSALRRGDYETAELRLSEAVEMQKASGDRWWVAQSTHSLGIIAWHRGDYTGAEQLFSESLRLCRELGDRRSASVSLRNLGHLAFDQGRYPEAADMYRQSIEIAYRLNTMQNVASCLSAFAGIALARGEVEKAVTLLGAADTLRESSHGMMPPMDFKEHERTLEAARKACDEAAFNDAWARGSAMPVPQAIQYALY